jgi:pyruvate dehydrogenase E1 component alpha subunit
MMEQLYRQMFRIRRVEELIAELYPQQQMRCPVHLCIGQEATAVGVCAELGANDPIFSTHRSHGHYLARGGSLPALLAELYGRSAGCSLGKGGSMHLVDLSAHFIGAAPILGATIALAVGAAFAAVMQGRREVTVAFFGDAAIEEGVFSESANFAALKRLPVVLVCENNQLSTCSPLSVRQPAGRTICDLARGLGLSVHSGDGNDVLEVARLARQAIEQARAGAGPSLLELHTYRWREHCGPNYDFNLGYRSEAEVEEWKTRCPLRRLQQHMIQQRVWNEERMKRMERDVEEEIRQAFLVAQKSPFPPASALLEHEYAP